MRKLSSIVIASVLFASSCKESTRVNLISGQVYQDCTLPLPNVEIALKSNVGGSFNAPIILGSGITAADGTLNFTYELSKEDLGTGSLLYVNSSGFEVLLESISLNQDVKLDLYRNDLSGLIVTLSGTRMYSSTDTLFYGITNHNQTYQKVQPTAGPIDTIQLISSNPNSDDVAETFYYGIGSNEFLRAQISSASVDSTFNEEIVHLSGCGTESTVNISID